MFGFFFIKIFGRFWFVVFNIGYKEGCGVSLLDKGRGRVLGVGDSFGVRLLGKGWEGGWLV